MKYSSYIFLPVMFSIGIMLLSCNKPRPRKYSGSVFTRHNNPVANAKLSFYAIQTSAINGKTTGGNYYGATTDLNGKFEAEFSMRRKEYVHQLYITSDSGNVTYYGSVSSGSDINIILE